MISFRAAIIFLFSSLAVFGIAFSIRWTFLWDIKPVSWDYEPPQNGALEAAFFLLSIENVAAVVAVIAAVFATALYFKRLQQRKLAD